MASPSNPLTVKNKISASPRLRFVFLPFHRLYRRFRRFVSDKYEAGMNRGSSKTAIHAQSGWSLVVPTDGKNTVCLQSLVVSFSSEMGSSPAEIIIVGPPAYQPQLDTSVPTSTIAFHELGWSPGWITRKKNLGVANARFDKVVVCHDYIEFQPGWKTGFDKFGEDFDVCMNRVVLQDGRRTRDWMAWDYPGIGPGLLPYDASCPQYQYISGTYFVVKRDFFLANGLDERLRWGDAEDVEWSRRIRLVANYRMNPWSTVRFSKPKPANDAPYCDNWIENTAKLEALFGDAQTVAP